MKGKERERGEVSNVKSRIKRRRIKHPRKFGCVIAPVGVELNSKELLGKILCGYGGTEKYENLI